MQKLLFDTVFFKYIRQKRAKAEVLFGIIMLTHTNAQIKLTIHSISYTLGKIQIHKKIPKRIKETII